MQTLTYGFSGIILILTIAIFAVVIKKSSTKKVTAPTTTSGGGTPPPLPTRERPSWTPWFKAWVVLVAIGIVAAIAFIPQVQNGLSAVWGYGVKNPAFGIGIVLLFVAWLSYNYENPWPKKHIVNARTGLVAGLICLSIWGWKFVGDNEIQQTTSWVQGLSQSLQVQATQRQTAPTASPTPTTTRVVITVRPDEPVKVDWPTERYWNYQTFSAPRPTRLLFWKQKQEPTPDQNPTGVMEKLGEDPSGIPENRQPIWFVAEDDMSFELIVTFSHQ